jgi:arginyl-tRNA synthetase
MRRGDSQLVFDIDLARKPVGRESRVYVQMAHARMCGIFRVGEIDATTVSADGVDLSVLAEPAEQELIKQLLDFRRRMRGAAENLEPHRVAGWLLETARAAHTWYHKHHVLGEPEANHPRAPGVARARSLAWPPVCASSDFLRRSACERS